MDYPTVSVIIPNYNHAPYLMERVDSVLGQTFDDIEVILLDDCSSDNSLSIIEKYRDNPKISHIVCNKVNSGTTFAQWKKGLSLAKGKYVWIAESDDFADKEFLSTLVPLLDRHPEAVMAFTGSNIVDCLGNRIPGSDWDRFGNREGTVAIYSGKETIARKLLRNNLIYNASMVVFRRESAPEISSRHLAMKYCGDWLFWSQLAREGNAIEVCRKLNNFRQHPIKVSSSASKEGKTYTEGLEIVAEMVDWLDLSPIQRKVIAGRICKRLRKFHGLLDKTPPLKERLKQIAGTDRLYPPLLAIIYEADKLLNFSRLPSQARG